MNFHNFFSINVFEVRESIADIPTVLTCSGDLKNSGQLPVLPVCVLRIFIVSSLLLFLRVRNSLLTFPTELPCSGDLENPGQLPVQEVLMILSYKFLKFLHNLCF